MKRRSKRMLAKGLTTTFSHQLQRELIINDLAQIIQQDQTVLLVLIDQRTQELLKQAEMAGDPLKTLILTLREFRSRGCETRTLERTNFNLRTLMQNTFY